VHTLAMDSGEWQGRTNFERSLVFVVEDDADVARLIGHHLRRAGFAVQSFDSGESVLSQALRQRPALFLLDIMLPGVDGFELCRQIRQTDPLSATPIVFLTAKTSESEKVTGLELGADDYITKPFRPRELIARMRSLLPGGRAIPEHSVLCYGDLQIDRSSMTIKAQGRSISATLREFRLLEFFAIHEGSAMTRAQVLNGVWNETQYISLRSVDVYIRRLRKKIEVDAHNPQYLKTLRGIGYRFDVP
jgi:DNA-binding response OmpR family regulator